MRADTRRREDEARRNKNGEQNPTYLVATSSFKTDRGLSPFAESSAQKGTVSLSQSGFETASQKVWTIHIALPMLQFNSSNIEFYAMRLG
ncbi:MAG TPA: hypothetical protein VHE81_13215 [Lacipirellulaceae bacterium]|nr:hypothetical protein [Lacipirellulaceae bacterium]